ncbi:photosystem I light harvesting complex gene 1 [Striga asiatica]|uniref:Photosystem I light harvesting complex gene 1 n=1 Tax=Striga asiatica TaxID=4170 RepID=A0A5A7NYV2_STRAF|nr:photosystem I light harvesting complex gene 1 [Striga asiatica]
MFVLPLSEKRELTACLALARPTSVVSCRGRTIRAEVEKQTKESRSDGPRLSTTKPAARFTRSSFGPFILPLTSSTIARSMGARACGPWCERGGALSSMTTAKLGLESKAGTASCSGTARRVTFCKVGFEVSPPTATNGRGSSSEDFSWESTTIPRSVRPGRGPLIRMRTHARQPDRTSSYTPFSPQFLSSQPPAATRARLPPGSTPRPKQTTSCSTELRLTSLYEHVTSTSRVRLSFSFSSSSRLKEYAGTDTSIRNSFSSSA